MTKEQFDELIEFLNTKKISPSTTHVVDTLKNKLDEMFPQFATPRYRELVLCEKETDPRDDSTMELIKKHCTDEQVNKIYADFYEFSRNIELLYEMGKLK